MIFGYTLPEVRKAVISFAIFALSTLAFVVVYDPGIKDAIIVVLGNGFAVAAVFLAPKVSVEDLTKTVGQLVGSVQSLLTFFVVIDPSVWVVIGSIVSLIPVGYAIFKTKNLEAINALVPAPEFFGPPPPGSIEAGQVDASTLSSEAASADTAGSGDAPKPPPPGPPDPPVPPAHRPVS